MSGAQLRAWREAKRASQTDLALELGVSGATISRLEQRGALPRLYHLALAALAALWDHPLPVPPA